VRIAVNTRLLLKNRLEGIGWFTYETLKRITQNHPEHEFFFIFDRAYDPDFVFGKNVTPIVAWPPARHPLLFVYWFEITIPHILRKIKADAFISPDAYLSLRAKTPTLLVIHDLNFEHYPEYIPQPARFHYKWFTPKFAHRADRIATVSQYSKSDIVEQYDVSPQKIDVVYNGANSLYQPIEEQEKIRIKEQFTQGHDYFIFIGALNPRKNLANLFTAFNAFKIKHQSSEMKLLVVGEKMYWSDDIKASYEKMDHKSDVIFTGRLEPETLVKVMGSASALTYPSVFEGFGIPIIEAFSAEIPVITSNTTAMPEVAGEAALLVDPMDIDSIVEAMEKIAFDKALVQQLIQKGIKQRTHFSWDITAQNLWNSFEKMMKINTISVD
jgi:glycosyltransferase involved in cell wall biosynthesis